MRSAMASTRRSSSALKRCVSDSQAIANSAISSPLDHTGWTTMALWASSRASLRSSSGSASPTLVQIGAPRLLISSMSGSSSVRSGRDRASVTSMTT